MVAATMKYCRMNTVDSLPAENKIPRNLQKSSNEEKCKWLHGHISRMLDEYVMDGVSDIKRARDEMGHVGIRPVLPCQFSGCTSFHAIITMRQMVGLEIQYTIAFPPISSCPPDFLNIFFYGIRYTKMAYPFHIWDIYPHC